MGTKDVATLESRPPVERGPSSEDDLSLGAEAKCMSNIDKNAERKQASPAKRPLSASPSSTKRRLAWLKSKSLHGESFNSEISMQTTGSHISSIEVLLQERKGDPEQILLNLGFGSKQNTSNLACRVPERFLKKPSKADGIDVKRFLEDNQELAEYLEQKRSSHHPNSPAGKAENMFFESLEDLISYLIKFDVPHRFYEKYVDDFIKSLSKEQEESLKKTSHGAHLKNICDSQQKSLNTQNLGGYHGDMQIKDELPSDQDKLLGNSGYHSSGLPKDNEGADAMISDTQNILPPILPNANVSHNPPVLPTPYDSNKNIQRSNHIPQNLDLKGRLFPTSDSSTSLKANGTGTETTKSTPKSPERPTTLDLNALRDTEHMTSSSTVTPSRVPLKTLHLSPDEHLV